MSSYAVGVITYRRPQYLSRLLDSLLSQTILPAEILLVDDGDQKAVRDIVKRYHPQFRSESVDLIYEVGDPATAQPGSRNRILERTTSDVICYLDDDEVCDPGWLEGIQAGYDENPDAVAVGGPAILSADDLEPVPDRLRTTAENLNTLSEHGEFTFYTEYWRPPEPVETDLLGGGNMSFQVSELRRIGGFDVEYSGGPAYYEETHVMAQFYQEDATVLYHPDAIVFHLDADDGGATDETDGLDDYWFAKNTVLFIEKNFAENRLRALGKLFYGRNGYPPSIARLLADRLRGRETADLDAIRGYVSGVVDYSLPPAVR